MIEMPVVWAKTVPVAGEGGHRHVWWRVWRPRDEGRCRVRGPMALYCSRWARSGNERWIDVDLRCAVVRKEDYMWRTFYVPLEFTIGKNVQRVRGATAVRCIATGRTVRRCRPISHLA